MPLCGADNILRTVIDSLAFSPRGDAHDRDRDLKADPPLGGGDFLCGDGSGVIPFSLARFQFQFGRDDKESTATTTMMTTTTTTRRGLRGAGSARSDDGVVAGVRHRHLGDRAVDIVEAEEAVETVAVAVAPAQDEDAAEGAGGGEIHREEEEPSPTDETQPLKAQSQSQPPPKNAETASAEGQPPKTDRSSEEGQGQDDSADDTAVVSVSSTLNDASKATVVAREEQAQEQEQEQENAQVQQVASPTTESKSPSDERPVSLMERDEDDAYLPDDGGKRNEDDSTKEMQPSSSSSSSSSQGVNESSPEDVLEKLEQLEEEREELQELEEEFQEEFGDIAGEVEMNELEELKELEDQEKKLEHEEEELVDEIMEFEATAADAAEEESVSGTEPPKASEKLLHSESTEESILEEEMERFDELEEEREELKELEEEFQEEFGNTDDDQTTQLELKAELEKEEKALDEEEEELVEEVMEEMTMVDVVVNENEQESATLAESGTHAEDSRANITAKEGAVVERTTGLGGSDLEDVTTLKDANNNTVVVEPGETSAMVTVGVPDDDNDDDDDDDAWNDGDATVQTEVEGAESVTVTVSNNIQDNIPVKEGQQQQQQQQQLTLPSVNGGTTTEQDSSPSASVQEKGVAEQGALADEGNQETSPGGSGKDTHQATQEETGSMAEITATGHKGTIPLTYSGEGSQVVHVDNPPVVGPVGSTATSNGTVGSVNNPTNLGDLTDSDSSGEKESQPAQLIGKGADNDVSTNNNSKSGTFSFDNPDCVDKLDYVYTGTSRVRLLARLLQNDIAINDKDLNTSEDTVQTSAIVDKETPLEAASPAGNTLHCENIAKYHPELCLEQIFVEEVHSLSTESASVTVGTDDLSESTASQSIASASMNAHNEVVSGTNEVDDDDYVENDPQRRLYDYPEDAVSPVQSSNLDVESGIDLVAANPSTDETNSNVGGSSTSLVVSPSSESTSRKIVVTIGSHYCPESCNSVAQCKVARDHFSSADNTTAEEVDTEDGQIEKKITETPVAEDSTNVAGQVGQGEASGQGESGDASEAGVVDSSTAGSYTKKSTCKDDLTYLYKGKEGYDCNYIKTISPELCAREHNGDVVGIVYCPESCNLVGECAILQTAISKGHEGLINAESTENAMKVTSEGDGSEEESVDQVMESEMLNLAKETVSSQATSEEGNEVNEMANVGEVSQPIGESFAGTYEGASTTDFAPVSSTLCKDDASFLYKGYEGYNCDYIKANKQDKCLKEHNGQKVGIVSCPESCDMVNECMMLQANPSGNVPPDIGTNETSLPGPDDLKTISAQDPISEEVVEGKNTTVTQISASETETNEPVTENATSPLNSCKDDPSFLYKGYAGFDCAYIKSTKPEKCLKERNGVKVGIISCPESCGMVEECLSLQGPVGMTNSDSGSMIHVTSSNHTDEFTDNSVTGPSSNASSEAGNNNYSEVPGSSGVASDSTDDLEYFNENQSGGAQQSSSPGESTKSMEMQVDVGSEGLSSGVLDSKLCKDDPNFLYKDKEGYTCHLIGTVKIDKCLKEHNGQKVGVVSCPESCNMVDECIANLNGGADTTDASSNEGSEGMTIDQGAASAAEETPSEMVLSNHSESESSESPLQSEVPGMGGVEPKGGQLNQDPVDGTALSTNEIVDTSTVATYQDNVPESEGTTNQTTSQGPSGGESSQLLDQGELSGNDGNEFDGKQLNGNEVTEAAESNDRISNTPSSKFNAEGTKSMADEIDGIENSAAKESGFNHEDLESTNSVQSGVNNTDDNDDAIQNEYSNEIDQAENKENMKYNYNYGGGYNDDATGYYDDDGVNSYENTKLDDMYKKADDDESGELSWEKENWGGGENESSNNSDGSFVDNGEGDMGGNWNDPGDIGFEQESWNSGGLNAEEKSWNDSSTSAIEDNTWDDDSGGMPTGLLALFFALVALFIYIKKKQNGQDDSRGGYQRVQPLDRGMYVSKRR